MKTLTPQCSWCGRVRAGDEWYTLIDQPAGDVSHGICPECVPNLEKGLENPRALMILHPDGYSIQDPLRYVPVYKVTTWCCLQPGESAPKMAGTLQWTAPFDERRFVVPMWVQEWAAAHEVVIR